MTTVHDHGISWVIVTDIALVRRAISLRRRKLLIGQLNESPLGLFIAGVELRVTFTQNVPKWNFNNEYQAEILHPKVSILRVEVSFTTSFAIWAFYAKLPLASISRKLTVRQFLMIMNSY